MSNNKKPTKIVPEDEVMTEEPQEEQVKVAEPVQPDDKIAQMLKELEEVKDRLKDKEKELDAREATLAAIPKQMTDEELAQVEESHKSKQQKMQEHFDRSPKVSVFIPRSPGETGDVFWEKSFNGLMYRIPKGVYVEVPKPVAENIRQEFNQGEEAGAAFRLDKNETKARVLA